MYIYGFRIITLRKGMNLNFLRVKIKTKHLYIILYNFNEIYLYLLITKYKNLEILMN